MSSAVRMPDHRLEESPNTRSIIVEGWKVTVCTNSISNAPECDAIHAALGGLPLPEMTFGNNSLRLEHVPSGWNYSFGSEEALRGVKVGELEEGDGGVKVGYSEAWLRSRTGPSSGYDVSKTTPTKPYDWTYTTLYSGHSDSDSTPSIAWQAADPDNPLHTIPLAELTRHDPIMFYGEIPLFEDELHDNGSSNVIVRIRVMPTCIFILSRFTLRVDNVLFRVRDTRIYHSFASSPPLVVKETSGWEAPYVDVKRVLPKRDDFSPMTDPIWVAKVLTEMPSAKSQKTGAGTGWRGLGTNLEVAILRRE